MSEVCPTYKPCDHAEDRVQPTDFLGPPEFRKWMSLGSLK